MNCQLLAVAPTNYGWRYRRGFLNAWTQSTIKDVYFDMKKTKRRCLALEEEGECCQIAKDEDSRFDYDSEDYLNGES
ncbi:hypothetical protein Y032_0858g2725 [Ancylostoma ceylanicum]|nr:hypothetical protein Y032_0858g2725 [Ancylostoma ceylanicum]